MKRLFLLLSEIALSAAALFAQDSDPLPDLHRRLAQARALDRADSLAAVCTDLSDYYNYRNSDSLLFYTRTGLQYADNKTADPYLQLLNNMGSYYNSTGDSRSCVDQYLFATAEAHRLSADATMLGDLYSSLGVAYRRIDQPDSAAICYKQALNLYKTSAKADENRDDIAFLLTNMAILYTNTSRLDEAERYIGEAVSLSQGCEDPATELYIANTAGSIYAVMKKYDKAAATLKTSLRKAQEADMPRFVMQCMTQLLVLCANTGDLKSFERYNAEAQPWIKRLPSSSNELTGYHEALAVGYARQRQYARSNEHYRRLIELHPHNAHAPLHRLHLLMARNCTQMGKTAQAAAHYERSIAITDSLRAADIDHQISDLNVRYRTQEKELEIAQLHHRYLEHKNLVMEWSIVGIVILAACISLLVYESFRRKQQQQQQALSTARNFIDGLERERARIAKELHDGVGNDLLGVGLLLKMVDERPELKNELIENIEYIRSEVRAISHELNQPRFTHTTLDEVTEQMLRLLDSSHPMKITWTKSGTPDEWKNIPDKIALETYRILQELMSNIVRHSGASRTDVTLDVTGSSLHLGISNDGKAFDPTASRSDGIGLYTVEDRVKTIGARFDMQISQGKQLYTLFVGWKNAD